MGTSWPAQADLFGPAPDWQRPGWDDRIYFALVPDAATRREVVALARQLVERHKLTGRPKADTLHVSVLGVGYCRELTPGQVAVAAAAAEALAFRRFPLTFTGTMSFGRRRPGSRFPLVLSCGDGGDGVGHLAEALREGMLARGVEPDGPAVTLPHLTLLYDDHAVLPPAALEPPISMDVTGVALIRNHHGQSRHDVRMFPFRR